MTSIYVLRRRGVPPNDAYDYYAGFVITANNPTEARDLAASHDFRNEEVWHSPRYSTLKNIGDSSLYTKPQIILADFRAG